MVTVINSNEISRRESKIKDACRNELRLWKRQRDLQYCANLSETLLVTYGAVLVGGVINGALYRDVHKSVFADLITWSGI